VLSVHVPSVGDGLAATLTTASGVRILVDCGSQNQQAAAWSKGFVRSRPEVFVLSHFHTDHYNGLLVEEPGLQARPLVVQEVYFPVLPRFSKQRESLCAMLAMQWYVLGSETGEMAVDLLRVLARRSESGFQFRPLWQGEVVRTGGTSVLVLWPPPSI
jgi:glyoxylase-like metal-dependent hydrolase (beta-lactamase superfamily II)